MRFSLTKWYLDCVTDGGEVRIGYAAQLAAGVVRLRYASVLTAAPGHAVEVSTRVRGATLPVEQRRVVGWQVKGLGLSGAWSSAAAPLEVEFLDGGRLSWRCLQPRASVELSHGARAMSGTGYAEVVTMSVPPWELPIEELRWGRAHVGAHTLVWIDWRGPRSSKHVFLDGAAVDGEVREDEVVTATLRVTLERRATLREGDVARNVFARVPAVRSLMARNKLALSETKWLSRATASDGSTPGWAIHEVVRWA